MRYGSRRKGKERKMHNGQDADDFYIQKDVGHPFWRKNFVISEEKNTVLG
jgi:hypothetical protein